MEHTVVSQLSTNNEFLNIELSNFLKCTIELYHSKAKSDGIVSKNKENSASNGEESMLWEQRKKRL